jgi:hypothetical protein
MFPDGQNWRVKYKKLISQLEDRLFMGFLKIYSGQADFLPPCSAQKVQNLKRDDQTFSFPSHWVLLSLVH